MDGRARPTLVLRAHSDGGPLPAERVQILIEDGDGHGASVPAAGHLGSAGVGARFSDLMVPLGDVAAAGVDLAQLASVQIVFAGAGAVVIDDLRFE
jgi:hypothetical protein